ncbi:hypothetical protein KUTeg_007818, partial [Tegillarca granosa]
MHLHKRDRSRPLGRMRFSGFKINKLRSLPSVRTRTASPKTIESYYSELEKNLEKSNLKNCPESIYNIDEKSISNHHNQSYVVFSCTVTPQAVTSPPGKITTILGCGNVIGQQLPPYYVFPGVRKLDHLLDGVLPGSDFSLSRDWLICLAKRWRILLVLYDGHTSQVTLSLIDWTKEHRIILFAKRRSGNLQNTFKISSKVYSLALSPENLRSTLKKVVHTMYDVLVICISGEKWRKCPVPPPSFDNDVLGRITVQVKWCSYDGAMISSAIQFNINNNNGNLKSITMRTRLVTETRIYNEYDKRAKSTRTVEFETFTKLYRTIDMKKRKFSLHWKINKMEEDILMTTNLQLNPLHPV